MDFVWEQLLATGGEVHNILVLSVAVASASPKLCSRMRKGTVNIKGLEKNSCKKKEFARSCTPLFYVYHYFLWAKCPKMKLLKRIILCDLLVWGCGPLSWASELIALLKQTKPSPKPKHLLFREKGFVSWSHRHLFCLFPELCVVFVCQQSNCWEGWQCDQGMRY